MPIYEYKCLDCGQTFETMRSMKDADAPVACSKCQSQQTSRLLSKFAAQSGGKILAGGGDSCGSCAGGSCATCRH